MSLGKEDLQLGLRKFSQAGFDTQEKGQVAL